MFAVIIFFIWAVLRSALLIALLTTKIPIFTIYIMDAVILVLWLILLRKFTKKLSGEDVAQSLKNASMSEIAVVLFIPISLLNTYLGFGLNPIASVFYLLSEVGIAVAVAMVVFYIKFAKTTKKILKIPAFLIYFFALPSLIAWWLSYTIFGGIKPYFKIPCKRIKFFYDFTIIDARAVLEQKYTPLHIATKNGCLEFVKELLEQGADVNARDRWGSTPLMEISSTELTNETTVEQIVDLLIENGADINEPDNGENTALHYAARESPLTMKVLIRKGANPVYQNSEGIYPIMELIGSETIKVELEDIKYLWSLMSNRMKQIARFSGKENDTGINSVVDSYGNNLLHYLYTDDTNIVNFLLSLGIDINKTNEFGETPLHHACDYGLYETAKILVEKGANINLRGNSGKTPLVEAVEYGSIELVEYLLRKGADPNITNEFGEGPLDIAQERATDESGKKIVELLKLYGAKRWKGKD